MTAHTASRVPRDAPALVADGVTVDFGGLVALDGVRLTLHPGEVLGLLGPNGSGKSTLVDVLSGVRRPTTGTVRLGDVAQRWRGPAAAAGAGVARTFQDVRLFGSLTVAENVEVPRLALRGASRGRTGRQVQSVIEELGLSAVAHSPASTLSYGDRRRLEIARAIAADPTFLLLDEPAAGMNEAESSVLGTRIEQLRATRGCGVLLIEHDVQLVLGIADRVVVLEQGRVIADGSPADVRTDPRVLAAYLGTPAPAA